MPFWTKGLRAAFAISSATTWHGDRMVNRRNRHVGCFSVEYGLADVGRKTMMPVPQNTKDRRDAGVAVSANRPLVPMSSKDGVSSAPYPADVQPRQQTTSNGGLSVGAADQAIDGDQQVAA
jgi:hypothetical protein